LGFVFQSFNLIGYKTALENALPLYYQNIPRKERTQRAMEYLEKVGLAHGQTTFLMNFREDKNNVLPLPEL
jgi:putative ABC transport system ATP-binding protein